MSSIKLTEKQVLHQLKGKVIHSKDGQIVSLILDVNKKRGTAKLGCGTWITFAALSRDYLVYDALYKS